MADLTLRKKTYPGGIVCLAVHGSVDSYTIPRLDRAIEGLFKQKIFRLIVDLANVDFMSSAGLGVLIASHQRVDSEKGFLVLISPPAKVKEIFVNLGLGSVFTFCDDRPSALQHFKEPAES
ncbi:MAG: STAS domain-containing protein [Planctomycetes bacterium]|nr:STAS domain-containing protein [Planctomycetota bacterium]